MTHIIFIGYDGTRREVDATDGSSVMDAAVRAGVPGIDGECGGNCTCATCHVHVDEAWVAATGAPEAIEEDMLDFAVGIGPTSRLSCRIRVRPELEGLVVHVPESQP